MKKLIIGFPLFFLSLSAMAISKETKELVATVSNYPCVEILEVLLTKNTEVSRELRLGFSASAEEKYEQGKAIKALLIEKCLTPPAAAPTLPENE